MILYIYSVASVLMSFLSYSSAIKTVFNILNLRLSSFSIEKLVIHIR